VTSTAASPRDKTGRARGLSWKRSRQIFGFLYAMPTMIYVAIFFVLPLCLVFLMSSSQWSLLTGSKGINFPDNYSTASADALFWPAVWFTIEYTVLVTVFLIGLGLGLALLIQEGTRWIGLLRTSFLLPGAMGLATASLLYWGLYSGSIGPLNGVLSGINDVLISFGLVDRQNELTFLGSGTTALISTSFLIVWKFSGFYMLILLVGLQAIPGDLYEAAAIDGASRWNMFKSITLPLLRRSLALSTILCITGSLLAFDQFYVLTHGGPDNTTVTVVQLIYRSAFIRQNLGSAAALSIIVLVALLVLNAVQFRWIRAGSED
jgi:multiple sugar transport system permease protein